MAPGLYLFLLSFTTCLPRSASPSRHTHTQNQDMALWLCERLSSIQTLCCLFKVYHKNLCLFLSFINIVMRVFGVSDKCNNLSWCVSALFAFPVQASGAIHVLPQASSRHAAENPWLLWTSLPRQNLRRGQHPEWTQRPTQRGETTSLLRP